MSKKRQTSFRRPTLASLAFLQSTARHPAKVGSEASRPARSSSRVRSCSVFFPPMPSPMVRQHRMGQELTGQERIGQDGTGQNRIRQDMTGHNMTGHDKTGPQDRSTGPDRTGPDITGHDRTRPATRGPSTRQNQRAAGLLLLLLLFELPHQCWFTVSKAWLQKRLM